MAYSLDLLDFETRLSQTEETGIMGEILLLLLFKTAESCINAVKTL